MERKTTRSLKKSSYRLYLSAVCVLLSLLFAGAAVAQEKTVTGNIIDKNGEPLFGVSVIIAGTTTGTVSDINGAFTIVVPGNDAVLEFSYIGYANQQVAVGERTSLEVVMEEIATELDQVVVIGYGTQKKSDLTGSVASISSEELQAVPVARVDEALEGRAAGVNVVATSGMPGANRVIQIRGISSINGANPLVVIDGIPGGDMNKISPSDIESIEVLKDAASAAIYGASGGNGVILITTKRGKAGELSVSANMYYGIQDEPKRIDMMNTRQWNQVYAALNDEPFIFSEDSLNRNFDWQDAIYDRAPIKNLELNITGGSERNSFSVGANYLDQTGMVENTGYEKFLMSFSSIHQITDRIKFDQIVRFSYDNTIGPAEWQYQNVYNNFTTMPAIMMPPFLEPYDENGDWTVSPVGGLNPFVGIDMRSDQYNKNFQTSGNFGLTIDLVKGLYITSRASGTVNNSEFWNWQPEYYSWANDQNPLSRLDQNWVRSYSWTLQNYLTYNVTLAAKHNLSFIAGMEASKWWDYNIGGFRQEFLSSNPDLLYFDNSNDLTTEAQAVSGSGKEARSAGYFGRVNYNYNELFLAQFNVRRDGNSNFGPANKWGNFYSGSVGFKFSELQVVKDLGFISFGKFRVGYGETGQFPITTYWPYASTVLNAAVMNYAFDDESLQNGMGPVQVPNADLKWETVKTTNIGVDLGFFKNQLTASIEYFNKINEGMIMPQEVSSIAGTYLLVAGAQPAELGTTGIRSTFPLVNYGSVSNRGVETTVDYKTTINQLKINIGGNFTWQKNEITDLATDSTFQGSVHDLTGLTISKVGEPIGTFRGYMLEDLFREGDEMVYNSRSNRYVFLDQPYVINENGDTTFARPNAQPGDAKWVDVNGDGEWNSEDYVYHGAYVPKFVFGFTFGMEYKGIDFSVFMQGVAGNKVFNGLKRYTRSWQTSQNKDVDFANRYHLPIEYNGEIIDPGNLESDMPNIGGQNWGVPSSLYIEDGSYLRLRSVTLGYTLPQQWTSKVGIDRFRIYFIGKNLMTFTKYGGLDPEVSSFDPKVAGIDIAGYPQSKIYTFGINLDF